LGGLLIDRRSSCPSIRSVNDSGAFALDWSSIGLVLFGVALLAGAVFVVGRRRAETRWLARVALAVVVAIAVVVLAVLGISFLSGWSGGAAGD
jgi:asparagine N-glycosylation enzyme membrane subunit Stt3